MVLGIHTNIVFGERSGLIIVPTRGRTVNNRINLGIVLKG
jgi:hypothetical protein